MLQIKKTNTQIKKWSFCMRIRVSVQTNHFFGNTNTQKTVAKEKNLCTEEKPSFVYLCIGVSGQRNHSLRPMLEAYHNFSRFSSLLLKIGLILCFGKSQAFQPAKQNVLFLFSTLYSY